MSTSYSGQRDDVLEWFSYVLTKLNTIWMKMTFPFGRFGHHVSIHHTCEIGKAISNRIEIGDSVYLGPGNWLNIPEVSSDPTPVLVIGNRCKIGRRCMISAKNKICLEEDVLLGPGVLIADHGHEFSDVNSPIYMQGITAGGKVFIGRNCWIGYGAAIICTSGELVIGRNSVIGTNSVVTRSVPPFCVVAGNPASVVRRYDPVTDQWAKEK
ncbi:MAG: hypothetical protein AUF67_03490 [Acidobacteria bacterium 13_1_20CM_58_21]|nr:MAG: hypothetical protein AUF67_03490 [Acidobacteria bacterium 13_1_20CM_58_21]